jgi:Na+-driven multidrug efflux pump
MLGWLVPGAGHLCTGYVARAFVLAAPVWVFFWLGITLGGHLHGFGDTRGSLLTYVFGLCDVGVGLIYFIARALGWAQTEQGSLLTAEYANIFLMVAGLLNYLVALDAHDIKRGRRS